MVHMLSGHYSGEKFSRNLWLWIMEHIFMSLISVFGEKGSIKFSHKGNILAFGEVARYFT